jgi:hypothetical protein
MTLEKDLENLKRKCPLPRQMQVRRIIGLKNRLEYTSFFNGQIYASLKHYNKGLVRGETTILISWLKGVSFFYGCMF